MSMMRAYTPGADRPALLAQQVHEVAPAVPQIRHRQDPYPGERRVTAGPEAEGLLEEAEEARRSRALNCRCRLGQSVIHATGPTAGGIIVTKRRMRLDDSTDRRHQIRRRRSAGVPYELRSEMPPALGQIVSVLQVMPLERHDEVIAVVQTVTLGTSFEIQRRWASVSEAGSMTAIQSVRAGAPHQALNMRHYTRADREVYRPLIDRHQESPG
jgi:hypothetical protein